MIQKFKLLILLMLSYPALAQDDAENTGKLPIKSTFSSGFLIETPSIVTNFKGTLEFNIQHRFSTMQNGFSDLFGVYGGANTRLALSYGITDRITLGIGTTQNNKLQDLNWKFSIMKQNREGSVPVSVSYFGNFVVDARDKEFFPPAATYRFIHRFSYFTEIMIARKFNNILSLQFAPQFVYYNSVDTVHKNFNYGFSFGGRVKMWDSKSIIFELDQPLIKNSNSKNNLALGFDISTATHAFQIFLTNYQGIIGQQNLVYNSNNPFTKELSKNYMLGFNITVRF
jgi:hypothetical protein